MRAQVAQTFAEFLKLEPQWASIATAGGVKTPFQSFAWIEQWLRHRSRDVEPFALVVQDGATIAPFGIFRILGRRVLSMLGAEDSDYTSLVTSLLLEEAWQGVAQELARCRKRWDCLHLDSVRERDIVVSVLKRYVGTTCRDRVYEVCPWIPTDSSWEGLLASSLKKQRKPLRRWGRRLEAKGEILVQVIEPPVSELIISEVIDVERASWKSKLGNAAFENRSQGDFLRAVLRDVRVPFQLWLLRIGSKVVAFAIVLIAQKRWYYYRSTFHQDYDHAGAYLLARIIEKACSSECVSVDLLRGNQPYKLAWTNRVDAVYEIVCPSNVGGRVLAAGYVARWWAARSNLLCRARSQFLRVGDRR